MTSLPVAEFTTTFVNLSFIAVGGEPRLSKSANSSSWRCSVRDSVLSASGSWRASTCACYVAFNSSYSYARGSHLGWMSIDCGT